MPPFCRFFTRSSSFAVFLSSLLAFGSARADTIRIHTTALATKAFSAAAAKLRDQNITLKVNAEGGSSAGVSAVANDEVDVAVTIRHLTAQEKSADPEKMFFEETVAFQALALIVSADVWNSGVHAVTRDQMTAIYENRIKNWKALGGEDRPIKFYNPEQGQGVWEPFVTWLYGDSRKAGLGSQFETVKSPEDARDAVEFNGGSIGVANPRLADGKSVFALGIKDEAEQVAMPTVQEMTDLKYPLARPIVFIVGERPTGTLRHFLDFMKGPEGAKALASAGLIPVNSGPAPGR